MFLEQARLVLTQGKYNLSRTSPNTTEQKTRRGSHGKRRDDKVQQKGRGVTESKGNAKESGNGHSPTETAAPDQVAAAADCPAASQTGGKNPTRRSDVHSQVVQRAVLLRWESPWLWARILTGRKRERNRAFNLEM